jgi:hypothetical protein
LLLPDLNLNGGNEYGASQIGGFRNGMDVGMGGDASRIGGFRNGMDVGMGGDANRIGGFRNGMNVGMGGDGRLRGSIAQVSGIGGCGRFGCGQNGVHCFSCRLRGMAGRHSRGSANHPYGGQIPHTQHNPDHGSYPNAGGGAAPTYAYPYYTTRGPRDFLMANPPSIGW